MKRGSPIRIRAVGLLLCALALPFSVLQAEAQADQTATAQLLGKAHTLEVRGRMDMAKQTWQQVLLIDPNNADALAGMARAAKLEGKSDESESYLNKLRAVNPSDPNIQRIENMGTSQDPSAQLQEAGRLAQAGQYDRAMAVLRGVYGTNPPPGDAALSYYQTEAATEEGRPHAIAGLRALVDKYPQDSRYQIALGKILTYNPRTRPEGRKMLEKHPNDPDAQEALRQALLWDSQNPGTAGDIRAYLSHHNDQQLSTALAEQKAANKVRRSSGPALTPQERAAQAAYAARSSEEQAAYNALNAHHVEDAEARFKAILAKNPQSLQALAGLGYVRMQQSNFGGAISYLEQAQQDGSKDPAVEKALLDSRFYFTMQSATAALNENDLVTAQQQFQAALHMRPHDPTALLGLGGTLLKAQQPEAAMPVFEEYVKAAPGDKAAWRGLFMAEYGAGRYADALALDGRIPPKVKAELMRDPDYLRTLASVYSALGRDADAQRVLRSALELPFPAGGHGLKADVQLQYAALLAAAHHADQAAGLYRQVLAADPNNASAWEGLVQTEHAEGRDGEAYQTLQSMPPAIFKAAMVEPGFETTVAAIYEGQGHDDLAQDVLEQFLAQQQAQGRKPFVPAEVELAGVYLKRGDSAKAYPLYRSMIVSDPNSLDAWKGLLSSLHATGHDQEAEAQLQQIPPAVRVKLEADPSYLQIVGSIYGNLGHPQEAMQFLGRVQQHYAGERVSEPGDVAIQNAWLLYNGHDDGGLYRQLMVIGGRTDLSDSQRLEVQTIWANWAVRRADAASVRGNYGRAIAILNAAAKSFPGNPQVIRALASGYANAGMPKEAVALFRAQDLSKAPAGDYHAAIGAALTANDLKDAETWLRFGLDQYPRDPDMLKLAAQFEVARGNPNRAAEYYRAALAVMPAADPGMELAGELSQPMPKMPVALPSARQPADLATLLSQPDGTASASGEEQRRAMQPYLPSYGGSQDGAPVPMNGLPADNGIAPQTPSSAPAHNSTLKDYVPQSRLDMQPADGPQNASTGAMIRLHPSAAMEAKYGPYRSYIPGETTPGDSLTASVEKPHSKTQTATFVQSEDSELPRLQYLPTTRSATMVEARFVPQQTTTADGTPVVPYAPVAKPAPKKTPAAQTTSAKERAAAIRANQANAPEVLTGVSHPPQENYDTPAPADPNAKINNAQYSAAPYNPAQVQGSQTAGAAAQNVPTYGQQYPQPNTHGTGGTTTEPTTHTRRRVHRSTTTATPVPAEQTTSPPAPSPVQPQPAMSYPTYAPPLTNEGYPPVGAPAPMAQAPSDYQLQQRQVPPLRGYFDPRVDPNTPLTPRQETELDLANIEGSYSGWVGGTAIGRYRSGTAGIDRLTAFSAPFEASTVINSSLRLTLVVTPVFLNSGQLDTQGGSLISYVPLLGTYYGSSPTNPAQQFSSGVGGEFQVATNTFSAAIGTTPWNFLVSNVIGRGRWKPSNGHFTFYGGRDPVEETQLSYAGVRDPGSVNPIYSGNVWGGVVQTGGGVRFDTGNERSGLYIEGEGADLTGYHVLENRKYDGTMGAYFRVKSWPEYGSLNIGGLFYGMHYDHNERAESYGLGGYFSPEAYFLAAVPITFNGHWMNNLHYVINGSVGVQTFQEDNDLYFPLDGALENTARTLCTSAVGTNAASCGKQPLNANTGLNFSFDSEFSYHVNDHWFVGAFVSANNTNNYDTIQGGFFGRYTFRPQYPKEDYPTGLFPVEGLRLLRVP
jgi:tetratricopeptide (TPR) repeat protein